VLKTCALGDEREEKLVIEMTIIGRQGRAAAVCPVSLGHRFRNRFRRVDAGNMGLKTASLYQAQNDYRVEGFRSRNPRLRDHEGAPSAPGCATTDTDLAARTGWGSL
jgi:hypothetical protein